MIGDLNYPTIRTQGWLDEAITSLREPDPGGLACLERATPSPLGRDVSSRKNNGARLIIISVPVSPADRLFLPSPPIGVAFAISA
jgi:hypothetical protein